MQIVSFHSLNRLKTKKLLSTSLIFPTIEYGGIVLSNMSCMSLKKLQTYQNACIRYIFGLKKHDHVSELRSSVMWLPVGRRLEHQTLCLLWKTMNEELSPSYLQSSFHPLQQSQHNTRSQHLLQIPLHRTDFMSKSFAFCAKFQISLKKKAVITVKAESGVFLGTRLHFSISFFFGLLHFMEMTFQICNFI
uniref:Uncharacterized protein n=1 Tax=Cacopsylla melanoneura TaxID=428564 RepID=A0A8D8PUA7_9HEMI